MCRVFRLMAYLLLHKRQISLKIWLKNIIVFFLNKFSAGFVTKFECLLHLTRSDSDSNNNLSTGISEFVRFCALLRRVTFRRRFVISFFFRFPLRNSAFTYCLYACVLLFIRTLNSRRTR